MRRYLLLFALEKLKSIWAKEISTTEASISSSDWD